MTYSTTSEVSGRNEFRVVAIYLVVFVLGFFLLSSGSATEANCDGTLRWIQGRLYLANGTPSARLYDIKTSVTYGILIEKNPEHPKQPIYPERPNLPPDLVDILSWEVEIRGKFLLCVVQTAEHYFDMGYVIKWDGRVVRQGDDLNIKR